MYIRETFNDQIINSNKKKIIFLCINSLCSGYQMNLLYMHFCKTFLRIRDIHMYIMYYIRHCRIHDRISRML